MMKRHGVLDGRKNYDYVIAVVLEENISGGSVRREAGDEIPREVKF